MAKRFTWRLETVLKARYRVEEQRQQDLARALARLQTETRERARIDDLIAHCRQDLKQRQTGRLNLSDLSQINLYLDALDRQHRKVEKRISDAQKAVTQKRETLAEAVRDRQILEKLKERDYRAYRKEERRRDQSIMDELAARRKLGDDL